MAIPRQLYSTYHLMHYGFLAYFFVVLYPGSIRVKALENEASRERLVGVGFTGFTFEQEIAGMLFLVFVWKWKQYRNADEAIHRFLWHAKLCSIVLVMMSGDRTAMTGLLILYGTWLAVLVPPRYQGPSNVLFLTSEESFRSTVLEEPDPNIAYLVNFQNIWLPDCYYFEPLFARISVECHQDRDKTRESMCFVTVDIHKHKALAEELRIDLAESTKQLPSLILFFRGEEIRRLPTLQDDAEAKKKTPIDLDEVSAKFRCLSRVVPNCSPSFVLANYCGPL